jgi:hypothetical protein
VLHVGALVVDALTRYCSHFGLYLGSAVGWHFSTGRLLRHGVVLTARCPHATVLAERSHDRSVKRLSGPGMLGKADILFKALITQFWLGSHHTCKLSMC